MSVATAARFRGGGSASHPLGRLIAGRLVASLFVVLGATIVCFLLAAAAGDPADALRNAALGGDESQVQALREHLGYGGSLQERFTDFLGNVVQLDFGVSYRSGTSALGLVLGALPATLLLVALAIVTSLALAVVLAVTAVLTRGRRLDRAITYGMAVVQGIPDFWLATMLVLVFSVALGWLPSIGFESPDALILPTIALAVPLVPTFVRLARGSLLDVMNLDFVDSLRANGLSERQIVLRHGLRNALPPLIALVALQVGWLVGGTIIVETIFAWPGLGSLVVSAVEARDLTVLQAAVAVVACAYVVLNLIADLLVAVVDPRVRLAGS